MGSLPVPQQLPQQLIYLQSHQRSQLTSITRIQWL